MNSQKLSTPLVGTMFRYLRGCAVMCLLAVLSTLLLHPERIAEAGGSDPDPGNEEKFKAVKADEFWTTAWDAEYVEDKSTMVLNGAQLAATEVDASQAQCADAVKTIAVGVFVESSSFHLESAALSDDELVDLNLKSSSLAIVSGQVTGSTGETVFVTALELTRELQDGTQFVLFTPLTSTSTVAKADEEAEYMAGAVEAANQSQPQPAPQNPPPGSINCFCIQCYLDCTDDCDDDYNTAVAGCNAIHNACISAANSAYNACIGSCNCAGSPGLGCSCLCFACGMAHGIATDACWAARVGCLTGAELGKTACYSGCWLGSWQSFPNPPGCPQGWTANP